MRMKARPLWLGQEGPLLPLPTSPTPATPLAPGPLPVPANSGVDTVTTEHRTVDSLTGRISKLSADQQASLTSQLATCQAMFGPDGSAPISIFPCLKSVEAAVLVAEQAAGIAPSPPQPGVATWIGPGSTATPPPAGGNVTTTALIAGGVGFVGIATAAIFGVFKK